MRIAVLGSGYVGLVTTAVFAEFGHQVIGVDIDCERVAALCRGESPIYEPGLDEMLARNISAQRLSFTTDAAVAVQESEIIFIAVGTPPAADGSTDLSQVESAARAIGAAADGFRVVVNKSTVPVGTGARVLAWLQESACPGASFVVLSNPEFLREGTALLDAVRPDRVVIGAPSLEAAKPLADLYRQFDCPVVITDVASAEIIKYASNTFLATKISFINSLADLCEVTGADIRQVARGVGLDPRIGPDFLTAGIGYGGSCLPKDVDSLINVGESLGCPMPVFKAARAVNESRIPHLVDSLEDELGGLEGKTIAVWGLAFKADTDDLRASKSLELCRLLAERGITVRAHDPIAMPGAKRQLPDITYCADMLEAATGADALILATNWRVYLDADFAAVNSAMQGKLLIDGRNCLDYAKVEAAGLRYRGIGHHASATGIRPRATSLDHNY